MLLKVGYVENSQANVWPIIPLNKFDSKVECLKAFAKDLFDLYVKMRNCDIYCPKCDRLIYDKQERICKKCNIAIPAINPQNEDFLAEFEQWAYELPSTTSYRSWLLTLNDELWNIWNANITNFIGLKEEEVLFVECADSLIKQIVLSEGGQKEILDYRNESNKYWNNAQFNNFDEYLEYEINSKTI
jgi:hypothetical protein